MYPPQDFKVDKEESHKLSALIINNPLATLLLNIDEPLPHISHIPFHFDECDAGTETEKKVLIAHVSNHHPLAAKLLSKESVQVGLVFHGEQGYISPHCHRNHDEGFLSNLNSKSNTNGQVVPTWNYTKVHMTGTATPIIEPELKYQQMKTSSQYFEQEQETPWELTAVSDKKTRQMLTAITFFRVEIITLEGHFKLSQNKSEQVKRIISEQLKIKRQGKLAEQIL